MPNVLAGYPDHELSEELHRLVDEMLEPFGKRSPRQGFSLMAGPQPFDISKPNLHDSKAEFAREFELVHANVERLDAVLRSFIGGKDDAEHQQTIDTLAPNIDARMRASIGSLNAQEAHDLVRKNLADISGYYGSLIALIDFKGALRARLEELNEQREKFWNLSHRAPDYYARVIANRLAKLYARETGQRPTSGSTPDSGQPSTGFTRTLRQVFDLLEISSDVRSPADWAIRNLKDEDLRPHQNALADYLKEQPPQPSARDQIVELMTKRPKE